MISDVMVSDFVSRLLRISGGKKSDGRVQTRQGNHLHSLVVELMFPAMLFFASSKLNC